eukprot:COSAG06_NODE_960_length_11318_cov_3.514573_2_plen_88_part_00
MKTQQTQLGNAVHSSSHTAGIHYVSCSLTLFLPACLLRPSFLHPLHAPFLHTVPPQTDLRRGRNIVATFGLGSTDAPPPRLSQARAN